MKKVIIDWPSPDGFGLFGFLCFFVALILVILMGFWYNWQLMTVCVIIFLCGGFAGRGFEKYTMRKEYEKKTSISKSKENH